MLVERGRAMVATHLIAVCLVLGVATSTTGAQTAPDAGFIRTESRITGDGPWTAWFGGEAERTLILTIENAGPETLSDAELNLRVGAGQPDTLIAAPPLDDLAPGERVTFTIDVTLPRFAFGTHAIEGTILGADAPIRFRSETTHVPWLLLLTPAIVLAQVAAVSLRNVVRRRADRVGPDASPRCAEATVSPPPRPPRQATPQPRDEPAPTIAMVIERELDVASRELEQWRLDDDRFVVEVERRARAVTRSVGDHFAIPPRDRPRLAAEVTRALLDRAASGREVPV